MEITVKYNKLFIQDLPAGGSFFSYFFFQAKYKLSLQCISPVCSFFLVTISTTNLVFQFCQLAVFMFNSGSGQDPNVFLGVCETPIPSNLWERIATDWQIRHCLQGRDWLEN
jgi:hypothetical protein